MRPFPNSALLLPLLALAACRLGEESRSSRALDPGAQLPQADPAFGGKIGESYADSTADYPQPVQAPAGAPNVLIVLLDDVGFGMSSTFGGSVPTPNLDKLASNGLAYTRFHTTALCSPTRAALLAGRNHHSVGTGVITEMGTGFPGYTGIIPRSTALLPRILRENGYATAMFGKWHNTPEPEVSPAGPFDRWPVGFGFEEFYGFNQGEAHQYYPTLYHNTVPVAPPATPEEGYHFTEDMTDRALAWIQNARAAARSKPWFCYFSTGAIHAPHHTPPVWREKFAGAFDHGWDEERARVHARQLEMGVIPPGTKLTPRPAELQAWDDCSEREQRVYARLMENYAGFLAHTDHHVGRLIDGLEASGELENTLLFYIVGDNGASAEGGLEGTFSELASLLGIQLGLESTIDRLDEIGGPESEPHVPVAWAWAMDAPFQWTKQVASHFGGTRNPMVVHWPAGIRAKGERRTQFHHVIDVVPTVLDACGIAAPTYVDGIEQKPIEGVSMRYTFDAPDTAGRRRTQYFEMLTNRAIYHDGWVACSRGPLPWETAARDLDTLRGATWELYHVDQDFSQAEDLAASLPAKLAELQQVFATEARKYDVFPLDPRMSERMDPKLRVAGEPPTEWTYHGNHVWLPEPIGPQLFPRGHELVAQVEIPADGAEGVITCAGAFSAGWSLSLRENKLRFHYNCFELATLDLASERELSAGRHTVGYRFSPDGSPEGAGTVELLVDGEGAGSAKLGRSLFRHGLEPFEIGRDSITAVDPAYAEAGEFAFTGTIGEVHFALRR